jgi:hypothetical protein
MKSKKRRQPTPEDWVKRHDWAKTDWNEQLDPAETAEWEAITEILNNRLIVGQKELLEPVDVAVACSFAPLELEGKARRFTAADGSFGWKAIK